MAVREGRFRGHLGFSVGHPDFLQSNVRLEPDQGHEIAVELERRAGQILVSVPDIATSPFRSLFTLGGGHSLGADGATTIRVGKPGEHTITLYCGGFRVASKQVYVDTGDVEVTLPLPPLHALTVRTDPELCGSELGLDRDDGSLPMVRRIPLSERVVFYGIPAGSYVLQLNPFAGVSSNVAGYFPVKAPDERKMHVRLTRSTEVYFVPE